MFEVGVFVFVFVFVSAEAPERLGSCLFVSKWCGVADSGREGGKWTVVMS